MIRVGTTMAYERPVGMTDTWLTPPEMISILGPFDLDPCAAPEPRPWPTASVHYTRAEGDGLARLWNGFCWVNPPYGPETGKWLAKLASHAGAGTTALVAARLNRRFLGVELNPEYVKMAMTRVAGEASQGKFLFL